MPNPIIFTHNGPDGYIQVMVIQNEMLIVVRNADGEQIHMKMPKEEGLNMSNDMAHRLND